MRILLGLSLSGLLVFGCGRAIVDMDAGTPTCTTNGDCPQHTLGNQQCGLNQCEDGVCVAQLEDAGHPCLFGFVDNDASVPYFGTCNGEWACCLDGGCLP